MASQAVFATLVAVLVRQSWAGGNLRATSGNYLSAPEINVQELEAQLLAQLEEGVSNSSATTQRLVTMQEALRPMFAAVPKQKDGTLSHNVVRYVLQRFVSQQHGWLVRGLEPERAQDSYGSSPITMVAGSNLSNAPEAALQSVQEGAPAYLQSFLEKIMGSHGIGLRELAIFAATLENGIHEEEKNRLLQAYAAFAQPSNSSLQPKEAFEVLTTYMIIYMFRGTWTPIMATKIEKLMKLFGTKVSHWKDTLEWLQKLIDEEHQAAADSGLSFARASHLAAEIGNRFASFNTEECGRLKSSLVAKESLKPGRVRLVDFYKLGLEGAWLFNEKIDFLRDVGTLDESDPTTPLVILPNYVQARSNCLAVSSFYAVCCPNECEHLMQDLEVKIVSSTARPSQIAKIVSHLSSASVLAPRTLSKSLMQRLQDIASRHGGQVPLHGRLFAQWMHHAFPRECAYPHAAGVGSAQTADEWMLKTGQADSTLTKDELLSEVASDTCQLLAKGVECGHKEHSEAAGQAEENEDLPWDTSEELLVTVQRSTVHPVSGTFDGFSPLHPSPNVLYSYVMLSLVYGLVWVIRCSGFGKRLLSWAGMPFMRSKTSPEKCLADKCWA